MVQSALADLHDFSDLQPEAWLARLPLALSGEDRDLLLRAWETAAETYGDERRISGDLYLEHAVAVATVLAELGLDAETVAAALLHDLPELNPRAERVLQGRFGEGIAELVVGVCRMHGIGRLHDALAAEEARTEGLRKMLLAVAQDVRVVFLALAERLHDMRTCRALPEEVSIRLARETRDIYAPLANRLGIWQLKWELEDHAFHYLEPDSYKELARRLAERRQDRERYVERVRVELLAALERAGIAADIQGRPKHLYSIHRKMRRKGLRLDELFDLRALRVLVESERECYAALGVAHSLWRPIRGEFDDYIANPKENNYRSLHTAVIGPEGKSVEVQIRTHAMHREAELGIAAHWRYKEGGRHDAEFERKIAWLRQILETPEGAEEHGDEDFLDRFKAEVFADRVYVLTPQGDVVDLPRGATALDFAYHIHTEVGNHCRGARSDGRMIPLTRPLENGSQVEVITAGNQRPSRDWLNPDLGYLQTPRARAKVRAWFRQRDHDKNVAAGRQALEREFRRLGVDDVNIEELAQRSRYSGLDAFLAALGRGELTSGQVAALIGDRLLPAQPAARPPVRPAREGKAEKSDVTIHGVGSLLTRMARCCSPAPGDEITGFITRGQGVTIHRSDCLNLARLIEQEPERVIEVRWSGAPERRYPVRIGLETDALGRVLAGITRVVGGEDVRLLGVQSTESAGGYTVEVTVEVCDVAQLSRLISKLAGLPGAEDVRRLNLS